MSKLQGKVAVVTGASKGIGAGIAKKLAAEGAAVTVNYATDKAGAERVVDEITKAGGKAIAVQGKVFEPGDVQRVFAETEKSFGSVTTLVNNAGVYEFSPIESVTVEEYRRQFDTNVLGTLLAAKEAVKYFGDKGGSIVNIGSLVATSGPAQSSIYSGTKGAIDTITTVLANELGAKKIRVNALNPGLVETEGTISAGFLDTEFDTRHVASTPLGRRAKPDDIAAVAAFLVSDDAGWLTGQHILASGGAR